MEAQVLELLNYYLSNDIFESLILLQGYKRETEKKALCEKLKHYSQIEIKWFKSYPNYSFFNILAYRSLKKVLIEASIDVKTVIHTRGEVYGSFAKRFLKKTKLPINLLVDIRGVSIDEISIYRKSNKFLKQNKVYNLLNHYQYLKNNNDTAITVVSNHAKDYFVGKYHFDETKICVHPNIVGKQFQFSLKKRHEIREKLGVTNDQLIALCSSNGAAAWQKDEMIMRKLVSQGIFVLNLSPKKVDIEGVHTMKVPFQEMPAYLSAADISVLWREDNPVNNTASPSKMSEFAAMGLYVIHNNTVGIASEYINKSKAGVLINDVNQLDTIDFTDIFLEKRKNWCQQGLELFGIEKLASSYTKNYKDIINIST
ncbi:hypothetical protein N9251_03150, partial [Gammaproteobacteria bacterium]|nr:hypothetical protein [Gammaproteobacteria bacterium]